MSEQTITSIVTNTPDDNALKLLRVLSLLRRRVLTIGVVTLCVLLVVGVYVFSLPRTYKSETVMLPETASDGIAGNIGALASLAGVKMGNKSEDAIYPEFYPKVTGSSTFLTELLKAEVYCERLGTKITLFDYFAKHQKKPWWGGVFPKKNKPVSDKINPVRITKKQQLIVNELMDAFFCSVDKKTDMVTVVVKVQDPEVASQIADMIRERLQIYITNYRTNKARTDLAYTKKITDEARTEYIKAQQKYAAYCDANEDIALASFTQVRDRLENEMQMAYNMYQQATQQMQLAQAKLQERTPVFVTIQPATVASKPSGPKRMLTMILVLMLSVFGSVSWILSRDVYESKLKATRNAD